MSSHRNRRERKVRRRFEKQRVRLLDIARALSPADGRRWRNERRQLTQSAARWFIDPLFTLRVGVRGKDGATGFLRVGFYR